MDIKIEIGRYDAQTRTVPVTFRTGKIEHRRDMPACVTPEGKHDRAASLVRVEELKRGFARKVELGLFD